MPNRSQHAGVLKFLSTSDNIWLRSVLYVIIEFMADIFLTNTLTRKKEKFAPIKSGFVGTYSCGPTVYRDIHIGNLRTYLAADILKRVLIYNGYKVKHIKNITDVGHMRTDPATSGLRGASEV